MRLSRMYKQEITLWVSALVDDGYGKNAVAQPVLFRGRWEDRQEQLVTKAGETITSKAHVFFPKGVVISIDDWICLGKQLAHLDPNVVSGAFQVRIVSQINNIRNLEQEQVAVI